MRRQGSGERSHCRFGLTVSRSRSICGGSRCHDSVLAVYGANGANGVVVITTKQNPGRRR
jgi:hypothetical protein